nr:hypothetical protein [Candidatus Sigynarchaeota archaeon]
MNSSLEGDVESISLMSCLNGQRIPSDVQDFMDKITISSDKVLAIIKDCMEYVKKGGLAPIELAVRYIKDIEEPEHQYIRVLFVLPIKSIKDALKMQTRFYNEAYREILREHLGEKSKDLDVFRRRVKIIFDIPEMWAFLDRH